MRVLGLGLTCFHHLGLKSIRNYYFQSYRLGSPPLNTIRYAVDLTYMTRTIEIE